jgi:hypothetical protein
VSGEQRQFDVFVLRYMPNVLQERFVNIGVLMAEHDTAGFSDARFLSDFEPVRFFDPCVDIKMLASLTHEIEVGWKQPSERAALLKRMLTFSGAVQLSQIETVVTDDPAQKFERLFSTLS